MLGREKVKKKTLPTPTDTNDQLHLFKQTCLPISAVVLFVCTPLYFQMKILFPKYKLILNLNHSDTDNQDNSVTKDQKTLITHGTAQHKPPLCPHFCSTSFKSDNLQKRGREKIKIKTK